MSKPYIEESFCTAYVSDLQKAIEWYYNAFGFQCLSIDLHTATLQMAPGRVLFLDTDPQAPKFLAFIVDDIQAVRDQLAVAQVDIPYEEDNGGVWTYFELKDMDDNTIGIWSGGFGMEQLEYHYPESVIHDSIQFYLSSREDSTFIIRQILDQNVFVAVSEELRSICKQLGVAVTGNVVTATRYTQQADEFYVCIPVTGETLSQLPEGTDFIRIAAQPYTVFPVHKSKLEELRSSQLPVRVKYMDEYFTRPESFYILEQYEDSEYIEAYIPYVTK